jgi:3'(2'), 5'-bisphosphate nucleotidase
MSPAPLSRERLIAELAVQRAAILTKKVLESVNRGEFEEKSDATPVTIADFAAQALLISAVRGAFPNDRFIGEESADPLRENAALRRRVWELVATTRLDDRDSEAMLARPSSVEEMLDVIDLGGGGTGGRGGRVWMMDPIDGTATYLRGEQYAVALALVDDGKEMVGVLGCPKLNLSTGRVKESVVDRQGLGLMLSATRGQGAVIRPMGSGSLQPATAIPRLDDGPEDLKNLHFVDSTQSNAWWHEKVREVAQRFGATYPGTELWSSHMRYVALIVGGGDVQMRVPRRPAKPAYVWDHAGVQLIFTEVGGKITDLDGREIDFTAGRDLANNRGIIAAKRGVHSILLKVVNEVLDDDR